MPRANRHYLPGYVWHITHRCHKQEFLLKFNKDKKRWLYWLFEAKKRYGLSILNYVVTSNHIHLLVVDTKEGVIAKSIQLVAGRTAQEYNQRKKRKGAFWEDRYHAVAVETDEHMLKCMVYIDLNIVRAGVVKHPLDWRFGGLREIYSPHKRYGLIDRKSLLVKCGYSSSAEKIFLDDYRGWIEESIKGINTREEMWTKSLAVGNKEFVEKTKQQLGHKAMKRKISQCENSFKLHESDIPYNTLFYIKKESLNQ